MFLSKRVGDTSTDIEYAAQICDDLVLNNFADWYLPSKDELILMYENLHERGIGSFSESRYWSSSEGLGPLKLNVWIEKFKNGISITWTKKSRKYIRAIRTL
jgi:hypothetical protein